MARTYQNVLDDIAVTAARNTLARAGVIEPTHDQQRAAIRCAKRHALQRIAAENPTFLRRLRDELAEQHATV